MVRLRGTSCAPGVALATACVLRPPDLRAVLPRGLAEALERARRGVAGEPIEVLLVAPRWSDVTGLRIAGARVAAMAVEEPLPPAVALDVPALGGVERLLDSVRQDDLVLLDAGRGILIGDPDGATLAAYQAALSGSEPRRRFHLERQHLVARTLDGREVRVQALGREMGDLAEAVEAGADSLVLVAGHELLSADVEDDAQAQTLLWVAREAAGKPLVVLGDLSSVATSALFAAAGVAELTLALPLAAGDEGFADAMAYLREAAAEVGFAGDVPLAGWCAFGDPYARALEATPLMRIVVVEADRDGMRSRSGSHWLDALAWEARRLGVPVEIEIPEGATDLIGHVLALGASGLVVTPDRVASVKAAIGQIDVEERRFVLEDGA
ncbi:MAG TPA: hypothetical protein VLH79_03750 [Chthonomonadales bacterium]|nr:hypothetical protein [Chthonomonadales bacterium]